MKVLVIIPTYNERDNVQKIAEAIRNLGLGVHVLFVDDSSPDRTYELVEKMASESPDTFLLKRETKEGLGRAYIAGFQWGLARGYEGLVQMDADFSHRPEDLAKLVREFLTGSHQLLIGSRYVPGGGTVNWNWYRKLISRGGSLYSRLILGIPVNDWTGGFNLYSHQILRDIGLERVKSEGYCFQIELKYKAIRRGYRFKEVPIIFEERRAGKSKMSAKIFIEAIFRVWSIRFST